MKGRKRFLPLLLVCLFLGGMPFSLQAAGYHVQDDANLFTDGEEADLEKTAQELSEKYDTNVIIAAVDQYGYTSNFAWDYIEDMGPYLYPEGFIGYVINMADRSYVVDAYGDDEQAWLAKSDTDDLSNMAFEQLRQGDYYGSAKAVLEEADRRIDIATSPMGNLKKLILYPGMTLMGILGSLALALAGAGIWTWSKSSRHYDKAVATTAAGYGGNLHLTTNSDRFVSRYQTRVPRPRVQSSGRGGGGFSGGGGGHTASGGHF